VACFSVLSCHSPRMSDYSIPLRIVTRMIWWTEPPVCDVVCSHVMGLWCFVTNEPSSGYKVITRRAVMITIFLWFFLVSVRFISVIILLKWVNSLPFTLFLINFVRSFFHYNAAVQEALYSNYVISLPIAVKCYNIGDYCDFFWLLSIRTSSLNTSSV